MILDKFLEVVELVNPDLFEELNGIDARRELDELKKYVPETGVIRVDSESIHDHYEVELIESISHVVVEATEPIIFVELRTGNTSLNGRELRGPTR